MKIKYGLFLFLMILTSLGQAQTKHSIFLNSGFGFNKGLKLREQIIRQSRAYSIDLGFNYIPLRTKYIATEIGLSGKTIFASGQLQNERFRATTFRLTLPLKLVFPIPNTKLQVATGTIFQNNVDFPEFDFRLRDKYAWRVNYVIEGRYLWKHQMAFTIAWQVNLRDIPDPYFINDPKLAISVGISKALHFKSRKNKKP